jgi:serine/threonine-protein kinase
MNLDELAAAIADGKPIDWSDAGRTSVGLSARLARRARVVERIAQIHASFPPPASFANSLHQSLLHVSDSPDNAGKLLTWGPLTIVERLGAGTFGEVYRAQDPRLNRQVALKLLRRRDRRSMTVVEEGQLMARVRHPNVVTVYGAERIDGRVGLWMEYVDGPTLDQELKTRGPLAPEAVAQVGVELCRALDAVHRAGLVHRDVKAQNVMRDADGRVLLTDFGAGRDLVEIGATTGIELAGTPLYLAPEVLSGQPASPASDIYSLGVLLFYLVTGSFPVHGRSLDDIREAHADHRAASITALRPHLPRGLCACVARAIDRDPARRFASAIEMEAALHQVASETGWRIGWRAGASLTAAGVVATIMAGALLRRPSTSLPSAPPAKPGSAALASATSAPRTLRQISADSDLAGPGAPSPDGTLLSYVDWNTCNLAIAETSTDRRWPVTNRRPEDPDHGCAGTSRFSARGSELFYVWSFNAEGRSVTEIRIIPVRDGVPRTLWRAPDGSEVALQHWAGDDRFLLASVYRDAGNQLVVIASTDGTIRGSVSIGRSTPDFASLSPDGSLIAYSRRTDASSRRQLIVVAGLDGHEQGYITDGASIDHAPLWTRDGRYLLFHSDRSGMAALWAQRIDAGRPVDPPIRLEPNLGWAHPMGLTQASAYFVRREMGTRDVYLVNLDPGSGMVAGEPVRVSSTAGANGTSEWAPDGRSLAFFRGSESRRTLVIKSLDDNREREIVSPHLNGVARPRWERGGRTMLLKGVFRDVWGLHRLDLQTEAITTLMRFPLNGNFQEYELFPDDRDVLYASRQRHAFVRRNLGSGRETILHRVDPALSMLCMALSRDGRRFAYAAYEPKVAWSIRIVDLREPANAREMLRGDVSERFCPSAWTADDREVIYTGSLMKRSPSGDGGRLWALNADTSQVRLIGLSVDGLNEVRLSPDGHRIAYDGGWPSQEVWVLDNVLGRLEQQ